MTRTDLMIIFIQNELGKSLSLMSDFEADIIRTMKDDYGCNIWIDLFVKFILRNEIPTIHFIIKEKISG